MKKVVLVGINTKYIHSNIAIRYLKKYVEENSKMTVETAEFSINNNLHDIITDLYLLKPDILGFSAYIWNIEYTVKIVKEIKKLMPDIIIVLGGPEVSYNPEKYLENLKEIDYIITGEGEEKLLRLLNDDYKYDGIISRGVRDDKSKRYTNVNFSKVKFPYDDNNIEELKDKIVYYESARGCPFSCSYCLSSIEREYRCSDMDRVKQELKFFIEKKVRLVKFIDRTFNIDSKRSLEIWQFLLDNYTENTSFHFEIKADILSDAELALLAKIPKGYFQFEIGIQTIHNETMKEIRRINNLEKIERNVMKINRDINLHIDLIAGLPFETYNDFEESFNFVYGLCPHDIQLGFLKILRGTDIEITASKHGYKYLEFPPYEVLENNYISFDEIIKLKRIEEAVESYYNGGRFCKSIEYVINTCYKSPFRFFEEFSEYLIEIGYYKVSHKLHNKYSFLNDFVKNKKLEYNRFLNYLKYDYIRNGKPGFFPEWYERKENKILYEKALIDNGYIHLKEFYKKSEFEIFDYSIENGEILKNGILFIYEKNIKTHNIKEV